MSSQIINQAFQISYQYPVVFTEAVFDPANPALRDVIQAQGGDAPRLLVVIDDGVQRAHPRLERQLREYALAHRLTLVGQPLIVSGGEAVKTDQQVLEQLYQLVADECIDRHSYILAIGGGGVLDAVGYAAATAHRGIRLIRMPSTVLAQNDAGIGVKNGINYLERKNFLGCFTPPHAVINDYTLLATLSERDKRAGIAEAVKVALIKDADFFAELYTQRHALAGFEQQAIQRMIYRCAELHLDHIRHNGDPFEMGSARPLDFGHWSAHKLEALSGYRIRHGEAVAMGILLDALYCHRQSFITTDDYNNIRLLLQELGFTLCYPELASLDVHAALEEFREHLGGQLCVTLLTGIGSAREMHEIDESLMQACCNEIVQSEPAARNV